MTRLRQPLLFGIAVLILAGLLPLPAGAQCDLRRELEQGVEFLERARELVAQSGLAEAKELLSSAELRLREAESLGRKGDVTRGCTLVQIARSLTEKAVQMAQRVQRGLEELEKALRDTDEFLQDTLEQVGQSGLPEARKLLQTAAKQEERAWAAFRNRRPRLALNLTRLAREAAERARRLVRSSGFDSGLSPDRVAAELGRTDELLGRVAERIENREGDDPFARLVEEAHRLQTQAWGEHRAGRHLRALTLTRRVRTLIGRALDKAEVGSVSDRIAQMITFTAELVGDLTERAEAADHRQARSMLDRASRLLGDAREMLGKGNPRGALTAARAASALALDVSEMLDGADR